MNAFSALYMYMYGQGKNICNVTGVGGGSTENVIMVYFVLITGQL